MLNLKRELDSTGRAKEVGLGTGHLISQSVSGVGEGAGRQTGLGAWRVGQSMATSSMVVAHFYKGVRAESLRIPPQVKRKNRQAEWHWCLKGALVCSSKTLWFH